MTPIIPPIWLYLFDVLNCLNDFFLTIAIIFGIIIGAYLITAGIYYLEEGEKLSLPKRWICILICMTFIFSIFGTILIPSQETMIYMAGLSFVTLDNVESGVEVVKNVFDYVITALGMGENLTN